MQSFDATLFEIGSTRLASTLAEYGITLDWDAKEGDSAMADWLHWQELSEADYEAIAHKMLSEIEGDLREILRVTLNTQ